MGALLREAVRCGCGCTFSRDIDQPWRRLCVPCWLRSKTPPGASAPAPRADWERRSAAPVPPPPAAPATAPHVAGRDSGETQEDVAADLHAALARTDAEATRHRDRADAAEAHGARLLTEIGRLRASIEGAEGSLASVQRRNAELVREVVMLRAGKGIGKAAPNLSAGEWRAVIRLIHPDRQGVISEPYRDEADCALKLINGLRERLGR